ncbi:Yip1 family protein [Brevundimonas sp.]|uniref:Yip1 family protein n=1 Tax=Brevundimonas sp. TaxID=1871086 RepID=UPI001AC60763|nr:Yip1 family protein [Brevundimonas sp.]MBN9466822.1 YIP1 family protein [Brevundimonas sp.]
MTDPTQPSQPAVDPALVSRVKGILLQPKAEWQVIDHEFATTNSLYTRYAMILAAIGPIASLIASVGFGHASIVSALVGAVLGYILALALVYVLGIIVNALATSFGGAPNAIQAQKLVVYSYTAVWIAGVLNLIPGLGNLGSVIGGIYTLVLLFLGLPILMKAPEDKKVVYYIVTLLAAVALFIVAGVIVAAAATAFVVSTGGLAALA